MNRWRRYRLRLMYVDWHRVASMLATFAAAVGLAWFISSRIVEGVRIAEVRSCHRLNIVRASDNRSQLADFRFDEGFLVVIRISATQQQTTAQQKQLTAQFVAGLKAQAGAKEWIPLTPCHIAVYSNFRPASPVSFNKKLPPKTALRLGPQN